MDQWQARRVAREIRITHPRSVYTDIAYSYPHGTYAVIVYSRGEIVALIDADAAASYLRNYPPEGSD